MAVYEEVEGSQRPRTARESPVQATRRVQVDASKAASKAQEPEKAGVRAAMAAAFAAGYQFAAVLARSMIVLSVERKAFLIVFSISGLDAVRGRAQRADDTMGIKDHCR